MVHSRTDHGASRVRGVCVGGAGSAELGLGAVIGEHAQVTVCMLRRVVAWVGFTVRAWVICVLMRIRIPTRLGPVLSAVGLVAQGEDRYLDAVLQGELGEDAADVGLDGLLADG